jgi:hypothetical protein
MQQKTAAPRAYSTGAARDKPPRLENNQLREELANIARCAAVVTL